MVLETKAVVVRTEDFLVRGTKSMIETILSRFQGLKQTEELTLDRKVTGTTN